MLHRPTAGARPAVAGTPGSTRDVVPFYTYFLGIGLGFLLIEVAQLQRLSLSWGTRCTG